MKEYQNEKIRFVFALVMMATLLALVGCTQETPEPGTITGRVYLDDDADAECDICDCDFYLEGITIQIYEGNCGGTVHQTVVTDEEGIFTFVEIRPGDYCVTPKVKTICEGYQPTTPIQQKAAVGSGETIELPWFGFDNNLDINN